MSRLTEEMIMTKSKDSNISRVKRLNYCGTELKDVSIVKQMRSVEVLSLSVNCIVSLAAFDECFKLEELYLRRNNISDFKEIIHLQPLPVLRCLSLEDNPIDKAPNYRLRIIRALPNLKKLDNEEITQQEQDLAMSGNGGAVDKDEVDKNANNDQQELHQNQHTQGTSSKKMTQHSPRMKPQEIMQQQQVLPAMPPNRQQQQQISQQMPMTQNRQQQQQISQPMQFSQQIPQQQSYSQQEQQQYHYQLPPPQRQQRQQRQQHQQLHIPSPMNAEPMHPPSSRGTYSHYDRPLRAEEVDRSGAAYAEVRPSQFSTRSLAPPMREYYDGRPTGYMSQYHYAPSDHGEWEEQQFRYTHDDNPRHQLNLSQRRSEPGFRQVYVREYGGERFETSRSTLMHPNAANWRMASNRCTNTLAASLSLVKELDYGSLKVLSRAVRHRIADLDNE